MKSPQQQQRTSSAPMPVSQASEEALGFDSPTYGDLAAEIAQSDAPVQGYGIDAPVQLRKYPHNTQAAAATKNKYRASFTEVEDRINDEVDAARDQALQWANYLDNDNARLDLWAKTAQNYFNNPEQAPDFIHARFGYAIEEISTEQLPANLAGLDIGLQVAAGHTRPDIVLTDEDDGTEVAWIDITAEESKDHILGKQGAGWSTRPFVSEILYDSLELDEVLRGMNDPMWAELGGYYAAKNQIVHEEQEEQTTVLRNALIALQEQHGYQTGVGNAATKKGQTRAALEAEGMDLGNQPHIAAKGALMLTELNPGPFGYSDGKSSINVARAHVQGQAQPEITRRQGELNDDRIGDLRGRLAANAAAPAVVSYLAALDADELAEGDLSEHVRVGITLVHCLDEMNDAANLAGDLDHAHGADGRTAAITTAINDHLDTFPANPTFANLRAWRQTLQDVVFDGELLRDLIGKADDFRQYLLQYYDTLDDATAQETGLLDSLNAAVDDYTIIEEVDQYMEDNPLD